MQMFESQELKDIIISVLVVTLIFAYPEFNLLPFYLLAVILAFLFHELAHRFVARKFGCVAFYKMWLTGLLISLVLVIASGGYIKFIVPGAVMIYPFRFGRWKFRVSRLTINEIGIISVAGILVNLFFAIIFKPLSGALIISADSKVVDVFASLSYVNAFLAFFNLLPIKPLDGSKVFLWKPWFWFFLIVIAGVLLFLF